jgi:uncharacterized protein (TIGR03084 family)
MKQPAAASRNVFDDLEEEDERLEAILTDLHEGSWISPSAAPGWTILDVVLHLVQTDEAVVQTLAGTTSPELWASGRPGTLDEVMDRAVRAESAPAKVVFDRWRAARRAAMVALREADPTRAVPWAAAPLAPKTLATTRLAEHWAHGLDITGPLGVPFKDTARLQHIAWLGHRSLPYALSLIGDEPHVVFCELSGPDGDIWTFGPPDAGSAIRGRAGEFCRVGAQRLAREASNLKAEGPHGAVALRALRNYAA